MKRDINLFIQDILDNITNIEIFSKGLNKEKFESDKLRQNAIIRCLEIIGGVMFVLGLYTQIAALVLGLLVFAESYVEYKDPAILKRNFVFYITILAIVLSLLLSGAGAFAIDLPL